MSEMSDLKLNLLICDHKNCSKSWATNRWSVCWNGWADGRWWPVASGRPSRGTTFTSGSEPKASAQAFCSRFQFFPTLRTTVDVFWQWVPEGHVLSHFLSYTMSASKVDQPSFGLGGRDSVLKGPDDTTVKAYKNLMSKAMLKLGANPPEKIQKTVDNIYAFELLLANVSWSSSLHFSHSNLDNFPP